MSSSSQPTLLEQTKSYVTDTLSGTLTAVKERLGYETSFPQSQTVHDREYLNDIVRGSWKPNLKPTISNVKTYPVVGFPINFKWPTKNLKFNTHFIRYPFLEEIKQGTSSRPKLRHVVTDDRSTLSWENWVTEYKYVQRWNRKDLLNEIQTFPKARSLKSRYEEEYLNDISKGKWKKLTHIPTERERQNFLAEIEQFARSDLNRVHSTKQEISDLVNKTKSFVEDKVGQVKDVLGFGIERSHPQGKIEHDREFLNDIARGKWESLNHVDDIVERNFLPVGVKIQRRDRKGFLEEVKAGMDLKHVEVEVEEDKGKGMNVGGMTDYKMMKGVDRKQLLNEITEFEGSGLTHVGSS